MPKVDMDMSQGTLATWHVAEGEMVKKGAALFDIETDKAAMEVEAPATGILHHILAQPGTSLAVGAALAFIYAEGEAVGPAPIAAAARAAEAAIANPAETTVAMPPGEPEPDDTRARATPVARRLARNAGIDLEVLAGTGPHGRVQKADVEAEIARRAIPAPAAPAAASIQVRQPEPAAPALLTAQPGDLAVTRRKGTGTPLVLLHGFAADSAGWAQLERALPRDLPLIRIDLPGHGRSPRRAVADFQDLARQIVQAFDQEAEGPAHLLGHSLGGALALALADIRPRQVKTLSLVAPAGLGPEIDAATLLGIARASTVESLAPWLKRLTALPDGISHDFAKAAMLARIDPELRAAQLALAGALFPDGTPGFDLTAALNRLAMPAMIVWGRDDHILPWRQALAAPGEVALHLMRGVGHVPQMEDPEALGALIARHVGA